MRRARVLGRGGGGAALLLLAAPPRARLLSTARAAPTPQPAPGAAARAAKATQTWQRLTAKRAPKRSLDSVEVPSLAATLAERGIAAPTRGMPELLQVNIGLTCNLACSHCHVESSPSRAETMSAEVAARVLELLANSPSIKTVDITGGAPEMHAAFGTLVRGARALGLRVIDRCNLSILRQRGMDGTAAFLAQHGVDVVASLPCYSSANVEKQRGSGVFLDSIAALQELNALGYGRSGGRALRLDLVYNPAGPFLPPAQAELEAAYRQRLRADWGIEFDSLFCITNMPIKRFADELLEQGALQAYMELLVASFNAHTVEGVMCRSMVHVAHDGSIHECDFHYALELARAHPAKASVHALRSSFAELAGERIQLAKHCWGCTAGAGSS